VTRPHLALAATATLLAGCSGTLFRTSSVVSPAGPDEVYACVQTQLQKQGFQRVQYDVTRRYINAQKVDPSEHRSDGLYRKTVNRLDVQVTTEATGTGLQVKARTFDEMDSQRGPVQEERAVTNQALLEAQELTRACSGPSPTS